MGIESPKRRETGMSWHRETRCELCESDDHQCAGCAMWDEKQDALYEMHKECAEDDDEES